MPSDALIAYVRKHYALHKLYGLCVAGTCPFCCQSRWNLLTGADDKYLLCMCCSGRIPFSPCRHDDSSGNVVTFARIENQTVVCGFCSADASDLMEYPEDV